MSERWDELAHAVDWWGLMQLDPAILSTKTQRLQMTYRACLPDTEQMGTRERAGYLSQLDEVFKVLDQGWALDADWWHEPSTAYIEDDQGDAAPTDALIDALHHLDWVNHPRHHSRLYWTLSWQPPGPMRHLLKELFMQRAAQRAVGRALRHGIDAFQRGMETFVDLMTPLTAHLEPLGADALCTYLHSLVSGDRHAVCCPDTVYDLDWQLTSDLWVPGQPPRLGDPEYGECLYLQPLTIKTWQRRLRTLLPEALSKLPFPLRYHTSWVPASAEAAVAYLKAEERKWAVLYRSVGKLLKGTAQVDEATEVEGRDDNDGAPTAGQSLIDLRRAIQRGEQVGGWLSNTVLVSGATTDALQERVKAVRQAMFQQGLVVRVERAHASVEWLHTLPCHPQYGYRARFLPTPFLTALAPHTDGWEGVPWDTHRQAPAVTIASSDGAPFYLTLSYDELLHVLFAGPSRSGKSGLMGSLSRLAAKRYGARTFYIDNQHGLMGACVLAGGSHYSPGLPGCPPLQLFGDLDSDVELQLAGVRLEELLIGEGLAPDPEERMELHHTLERLADLPRRRRTMSMLRQLLQVKRLKVGLEPFCVGGPFGYCDGEDDLLAWGSTSLCFEMSHLLKVPRARNPILSYLFQALDKHWITGEPVIAIMDEAKWLAEISRIFGEMEVYLKAKAKLNLGLWIAVQELYDLAKTNLWQAVLSNMKIRILLPNQDATSSTVRPYYEEVGVTDQGFEGLVNGVPKRDYLYCSPRGQKLFQYTLHPVERRLCACSTPEEIQALQSMAPTVGRAALPAAWLRRYGHEAEAALLMPRQEDPLCGDSLDSPSSALVLG